jgi:hypothetical protein
MIKTEFAIQSQEDADRYWATREWKKYVVTLEQGPASKPQREVKYVTARTRHLAVQAAKRNAMTVLKPARIVARLATAQDLGCVRVVQ